MQAASQDSRDPNSGHSNYQVQVASHIHYEDRRAIGQ
jgi:hypothetical protein